MLIAVVVAATAATTANAQLFQMEFTAVYKDYFNSGGGGTQTGVVMVTGTVVWDSQTPSTFTNGSNSRSWDYISFEARGIGHLEGGHEIDFTLDLGPSGSTSNSIQTVHIPSQNASNMYWRSNIDPFNTGSGVWDGSFYIFAGNAPGMPDFTSPLPTTAAGYEGSNGFSPRLSFTDADFNFIDMELESSTVVITPLNPDPPCIADINGDGELNFFDVSAYISLFTAGCP